MDTIAYFSAWGGIIGGIWLLFSKAEDTVNPEIKTTISSWLRNLNPEGKLANLAMTFASMFDGIFGKKHFSWRCFSRSCIASFAAVMILTIICWMISPREFILFFGADGAEGAIYVVFSFLVITILLNTIPDYFSLLETRYIITKMRNTNSLSKILGFFAIDFVATIIIFLIGLIIVSSTIIIVFSIFTGRDVSTEFLDWLIQFFGHIFPKAIFFKGHKTKTSPLGIWFYSTFFTSVWVYLYVLSGLIIKAGAFSGILVGRIRRIFDINKKPLRSMGIVCIIFISIIFLIAPFVKLLL